AGTVPANYFSQLCSARLLVAAKHYAALLLAWPRRYRARRIPARAQPGVCACGQRDGLALSLDYVAPRAAQRHGRDANVYSVSVYRRYWHPDRAGLPRFRPASRRPLTG